MCLARRVLLLQAYCIWRASQETNLPQQLRARPRMFHNQGYHSQWDSKESTTWEASTIHPRKIKHANRFACLPFESCINDASRFPPPATSCGISYLWICSLDQNAARYFKRTACARIHSRMRSMEAWSRSDLNMRKTTEAFCNIKWSLLNHGGLSSSTEWQIFGSWSSRFCRCCPSSCLVSTSSNPCCFRWTGSYGPHRGGCSENVL